MALRFGQNFDAFHVMTRLTDRHKTIPYFKKVLVSSDTWGRSNHEHDVPVKFLSFALVAPLLAVGKETQMWGRGLLRWCHYGHLSNT